MSTNRFVGHEEVMQDYGVSRAKAYALIREMNSKLESRGYCVIRGKVDRRFYEEQFYHGQERVACAS